jgi:hypothetical protein
MPAKTLADVDAVLSHWTADTMDRWLGSWVRFSEDGHAWSDFLRAPVTAPHGPITLSGDGILYLGKKWGPSGEEEPVAAFRSNDVGYTWDELGCVPLPEGCVLSNLTEPHVLQLPSGKLIGMIRYEYAGHPHERLINFSLLQTVSVDCGQTWSAPQDIGVAGSPPHLLRHSSGTIICSYGYRKSPYGQRVIVSHDDGKTWDGPFVLRDDGPDGDLGYPCSVELSDSRILTVYYQKPSSREDKCAILYSRWALPE